MASGLTIIHHRGERIKGFNLQIVANFDELVLGRIKDCFRCLKFGFDYLVMFVACGYYKFVDVSKKQNRSRTLSTAVL